MSWSFSGSNSIVSSLKFANIFLFLVYLTVFTPNFPKKLIVSFVRLLGSIYLNLLNNKTLSLKDSYPATSKIVS